MNWIEAKVTGGSKLPDNCIWVECIAEIRDNATGEVVEYETNGILDINEEHPSIYNWEEGNFSCDCNRLLFFNKAKNIQTEEDWDTECSDGKYSVNLKNKKDGKVYYREFDQ